MQIASIRITWDTCNAYRPPITDQDSVGVSRVAWLIVHIPIDSLDKYGKEITSSIFAPS